MNLCISTNLSYTYSRKASRVSVVSIAPVPKKKPSLTLPPIRHVPPQHRPTTELATVEVPDPDSSTLPAPSLSSQRRLSACYLTELKLMDIGPPPRDLEAEEEAKERERKKRLSLDVTA
ncbi:unnamed protein product [Cylicostephanus goldi]|uniref:Uncharacterized protein n=1 Tax=Cylicostephanus goldi TaxID=71465 RepID=A0A3P6RDL4_CYLGO|nr:unnamed protein product [Cylicostephanus goldi]